MTELNDMSGFPKSLIDKARELCSPMEPIPIDISAKIHRLDGIRAVLFDVYGTLFVSGSGDVGTSIREMRTDSFQRTLSRSGFTGQVEKASERGVELIFEEVEKAHVRLKAKGIAWPEVEIRDIFSTVLNILRDDGLITGTVSRDSVNLAALEYECSVNPVWPMSGAAETLRVLREKDLVLGIVSNAQFYTPVLFEALFGWKPEDAGFDKDLVAWSFEKLEAKPSPAIFQRVLEPLQKKHGISPGESLYMGNSMTNDVIPSSRLGCRTALFAGDERSYQSLDDPSFMPDVVITDLRQLIEVV